jgi:plastocyanin
VRKQISTQAKSGISPATSGIVIAVIAIIIAASAIGAAFVLKPSSSSSPGQASSISSLSSEISALKSEVSGVNSSVVNVAPSVVPVKIDWCNTDNTGQDRFCPPTIIVDQGDIVQVLFLSNDTDAHTFTLQTAPYDFQINLSYTGAHNFISNTFAAGDCSNTGTYAQISSAISGTYCVSGSSLLTSSELSSTGASDFLVQNADPADSPPVLQIFPVNYQDVFSNTTSAAIAAGTTESWGIGAFQATMPGVFEYFCHYHVSNGMFGYLIVLPNAYCISNPSSCNVVGGAS